MGETSQKYICSVVILFVYNTNTGNYIYEIYETILFMKHKPYYLRKHVQVI